MGGRKRDRAAVREAVVVLTARLRSGAEAVRGDEPDSVHQMRVTARRLRSLLHTFSSVFPESRSTRAELRWLGSLLGRARDTEVLADRFEQVLDGLAEDLVRGTVRHRLVAEYREQYHRDWNVVVLTLAGSRFTALLAALDRIADESGSGAPHEDLRRAHRRVVRAGRKAGLDEAAGAPGPDDALHTTRKRAKALRYAAEVLSVPRPSAGPIADAAEHLQDVLGEHQDSTVARAAVLAAADRARAAGEDTFTFGVVVAAEVDRARRSAAEARGAWRAVERDRGNL